jgi:hypothetical protein
MASQSYYSWLSAGQPYTLARPCKQLQKCLQGHGFVVYDYPNTAHLTAGTPEDHTPFSATGYPSTSPRWWGHAIDIMPKGDSASARKEIADLARQFIAMRDGGLPALKWLKYMNWTDENGTCRQENWKTGTRRTYSSSDKGHIHMSSFTGYESSTVADGYDPYDTQTGGGTQVAYDAVQGLYTKLIFEQWDPDAKQWAAAGGDPAVYALLGQAGSGRNALKQKLDAMDAKLTAIALAQGVAQSDIDDIQARTGTVVLSPADLAALRAGIVADLVAADTNELSDADKANIEEIVDRQLDQFAHGAADTDV